MINFSAQRYLAASDVWAGYSAAVDIKKPQRRRDKFFNFRVSQSPYGESHDSGNGGQPQDGR